MSRTGSGTQADPYIVDSFEDFVTTANTNGVYMELPADAENKVMDVNDSSYRNGKPKMLELRCASLNGNGWTIRNLNITDTDNALYTTDARTVTVRNLHFENLRANTGSNSFLNLSPCLFEDCSFACVHTHGDSASSFSTQNNNSSKPVFRRCAISITKEGTGSAEKYFRNLQLDTCTITLNLPLYGTNQNLILFWNCNVSNCIIRGQASVTFNTASNHTLHLTSDGTWQYSYFAVDWTNASASVTATLAVGAATNMCFLDASRIGEHFNPFTDAENFRGLTTAQAKDAAYLSGIGFTCLEV